MTAWAELVAAHPAACVCLTFVVFLGVAMAVRAIRREGGR